MKFSDAIINVLLLEEAKHGTGAGLTRREMERMGTSLKISRREARNVIFNLVENNVLISTKKMVDGKKEKTWTVNRKKLVPVGQ